jgi:hypothetical protein
MIKQVGFALCALSLLLCPPLTAQKSLIGIGPSIVGSNSLGYESPYLGATGQAELKVKPWAWRLDASVLNAHKTQTKDGVGYSVAALMGLEGKRGAFLVGTEWAHQSTDDYEKSSYVWLVEGWWKFSPRVRVGVASEFPWGNEKQIHRVVGVKFQEDFKNLRILMEAHQVDFIDFWGAPQRGHRAQISVLWTWKGH